MSHIRVRPGPRLSGEVSVGGAKNSALKLMAASLLAEGRYTLRNMPAITDVDIMSDLLRSMGAQVDQVDRTTLTITQGSEGGWEAPYELVERMRASIVVLGPLLARYGRARVALPGGDDFGSRPIDMHLKALEQLGATFELSHGYVEGRADKLVGSNILLEFPSVGATENVLMAAVMAKGTTVIDNAAREPEIVDICNFLLAMGAEIRGVGTSMIEVEGLPHLHSCDHTVIPDRIEAATYLLAVAIAGGEITVQGARADHMDMLLRKLREMGLHVTDTGGGLWAHAPDRLRSTDVSTLPYPGVATDYKPFLVAALTIADGVAIVSENLFTGRFKYVSELLRMGAHISTESHHAVVRGVPKLSGAPVRASDIRAGAALVLAGLRAEGETQVGGAEHIGRGYADLPAQLRRLGADVTLQQTS